MNTGMKWERELMKSIRDEYNLNNAIDNQQDDSANRQRRNLYNLMIMN